MNSSKPIFKKDYLEYLREEKEGYWLVVSKRHPEVRELLLNKTSVEIFEACDGSRTVEELIDYMKKKYELIPYDKVKKDVNRILSISSRLGLTSWIGENPFIFDYPDHCHTFNKHEV